MIELSLLKHFIAVARTGSFTRASETLNASQSVVSRSVKRLEDQVGTVLLERSTRNVKLTKAGEALLCEGEAIVARLTATSENVRRIGQGAAPKLRVGVCSSTADETRTISRGFQTFREAYPLIDLELTAAIGPAQHRAILAGEMDVGIMRGSGTRHEGLDWQVIARDPLALAVPSVWNLGKTHVRLEEMRDRPWIMPDPRLAPSPYEWQIRLCREAGFEPRIVAVVDDRLTSGIMIACGMAAAFSNNRRVGKQDAGVDYVSVEGLSELFVSDVVVAWATGSESSQVMEFVRCVVEAASPGDGQEIARLAG